jgi:hypothetical protein
VLLASDQHRIGSLVTVEARTFGIPTAVLQHGLPQHRVGYVPVIADRLLAWSEQSKRWFVARGADPRRVVVVGNPTFDAYGAAEPAPASGPLRVLLALTPVTTGTNEMIVQTALDALTALPTAELTLKLHPGDGHWDYVRALVAGHEARDRVVVRHREPLQPEIQRARVVWVHRSTVAVEALAAGVPVVIVRADTPSTADMELSGLDLPVADDASSLARLTRSLDDSFQRDAYFAARPVLEFVGPRGAAAHVDDALRDLLLERAA